MHEQFVVTYIDPEFNHLLAHTQHLSQSLPTIPALPVPENHRETETHTSPAYQYSLEQTARLLGISLKITSATQLQAAIQSVPSFLVEVAVVKQNQQLTRRARCAKILALHVQFMELYAISLEHAQHIRRYARNKPDQSLNQIIKDRLQLAAKQHEKNLEHKNRPELKTYGSIALKICHRYRYKPPGIDRITQETSAWTMLKNLQAIIESADGKIIAAFEQTYAISLQLAQKIWQAYQQVLADLKANREPMLQLTDG